MRDACGKFAPGSRHLVTHGMRQTKIYTIWRGMRSRCQNPNVAAYPNYGGRGITVCPAWQSFENFYRDMGDPPAGFSLDRVNNDLGYSPENCRWATRKEQSRNQRGLRLLTIDGVEKSMGEWAEISGLALSTIWARLKNGWSPQNAVFGRKVVRKGVPKGAKLRDHQGYAEHGVQWSEPS